MVKGDTKETSLILRAIITELPQSLEAGGSSQLSLEELYRRLSGEGGWEPAVELLSGWSRPF